jgi:phosphate transport system substrate-binding protein
MKNCFSQSVSRIGATCLLSLVSALVGLAQAEEIKIGGTGNALGSMRLMGDAFSAKYPEIKVTVLGSIGTSGAIKGVPKGAVSIGVSSRPLTEEESATGLVASEYARTLTVFAVSTKSKVTGITSSQVADIYKGTMGQWPDGTTIRPVLRQPGDDNTKQVRSISPEVENALLTAEKREGLAHAFIDQEAAEKIESIPGAIGVSTLALIKSEGRALRPLIFNGIEPTAANGASGKYPLIKRFYFLTMKDPVPAVQNFIAFANSAAGWELLTKNGHWHP